MTVARPVWIAAAGLLVVIAALLAWGLARTAWDDAHPVRLAGARACPLVPPVASLIGGGCGDDRDLVGGNFGVIGNAPCACDGPGQPVQIGKASVTLGSRDWAACVARGPGFTMETSAKRFVLRYQIPKGWTAFTRSDGKRHGCWMVPDSQIDSENPRRLLDRAEWPELKLPDPHISDNLP